MEKLAFYDIQKILEQLHDSRSSGIELDHFLDDDNQNNRDFSPETEAATDLFSKLGNFKRITPEPEPREGYGDVEIIEIYYFEDHDVYVRFKGSWTSYNGTTFESMREVKPITKTVTCYE